MPSITDLPFELIGNVSSNLNLSSVLALRHTNRRLTVNSATALTQCSEITITCSKAGLERLAKLVTISDSEEAGIKQKLVANIEHVTIHMVTAQRLVELAESFADNEGDENSFYDEGDENPFSCTYVYMRKTIIAGLNAMPKLHTIVAPIITTRLRQPYCRIKSITTMTSSFVEWRKFPPALNATTNVDRRSDKSPATAEISL
jgi:hypothetical protein